jgi:bifunctional DNA-binding transcriptional regulator/antitoxin component of YhaV-PrlF toxin-antitoxin module
VGRTQLTDGYQIKIPLEIWGEIGVKPGDLVELRIEDGSIIIERSLTSSSDYLGGLHAEISKGVDPDECIRQERDSWGTARTLPTMCDMISVTFVLYWRDSSRPARHAGGARPPGAPNTRGAIHDPSVHDAPPALRADRRGRDESRPYEGVRWL